MTRERPHHLRPKAETVRVAIVYRDFSTCGVCHVGLGISCALTAKTLRNHGLWVEVWPEPSAKSLVDHLRKTYASADQGGEIRPTHVIIGAPWLLTADVSTMAGEFPEISFVVVSHSAVGFLSADPHAIRLLRETADLQLISHNVFVAGNSIKFTKWATAAWGVNVVWLPNLYCTDETFQGRHAGWTGGVLRLGLFGANRPLKNFLSGAAAAVELATQLRVPTELHISTGRNEGGNSRALEELTENVPNLKLIQTDWLSWPQFRAYLRRIDLVLQVSYTETFNIVTADAVAEGIPVVGSDAIDWIPKWWQAPSDEPSEITRVAEQLLRDPHAARAGRIALEEYLERGLRAWRRFLIQDDKIKSLQ